MGKKDEWGLCKEIQVLLTKMITILLVNNNLHSSKWFFCEIFNNEKGKHNKQYLFFISQLVVYCRFLGSFYFHLLCWSSIWRVAVSQVAHSWICKLEFFVSGKPKNTCLSSWEKKYIQETLMKLQKVLHKTWDLPVNNECSYEDQDCQYWQSSTNHVADMRALIFIKMVKT